MYWIRPILERLTLTRPHRRVLVIGYPKTGKHSIINLIPTRNETRYEFFISNYPVREYYRHHGLWLFDAILYVIDNSNYLNQVQDFHTLCCLTMKSNIPIGLIAAKSDLQYIHSRSDLQSIFNHKVIMCSAKNKTCDQVFELLNKI